MIAVVNQSATEDQLAHFISWIENRGFRTNVSKGENETIVGIIGDTTKIDPFLLESMDIIDRVQRVSEPYKKANRKYHPEDTGIDLGGGTLLGLCERLAQVSSFDTVLQLAGKGDLHKVDLTIGDISTKDVGNMNADVTAANFGKLADDAAQEDLVAGVVNMVFQTIGMLAVFAVRESTTRDIVLTGTLTVMPEIREVFSALEALHPVNFILPENSVFATAIGAALLYLDKQQA